MLTFIRKYHRIIFYGCWLLVNILQASFTQLFDDEAYYWLYSKFPAWGYFDHPPMIAMLIKAGGFLFPKEAGVRFFAVLLNTACVFLIEELTDKKKPFVFYAICGSIALAQVGGIIAVPDLPLLFFVSLFFLFYRRFINNNSITNSLLLGASIACMLFSKYHGILIIFFTLLSNLSLLRNSRFYLVVFFSVALFVPHIAWQIANNYPSIQFHLFERNASHYEFSFTLDYILGQILLTGPVMGWLLVWSAFKSRTSDATERALKFSLIGFYAFFLLSTFKGRVEANWTVPAFVPLIVLSYLFLSDNANQLRLLLRMLPVTIFLVLAGRIFMFLNLPRSESFDKDEFHGNYEWTRDIKNAAGDIPVVIINSYQKPSKYWFYTGTKAFSLNTPAYRRNNFNYWPIEDSLIGKPAYVLGTRDTLPFFTAFHEPYLEEYGGAYIKKYYSFSRIQFTGIKKENISQNGVTLSFKSVTPESYLKLLHSAPYDTAGFYLAITNEINKPRYYRSDATVRSIQSADQQIRLLFPVTLAKGKYSARLGISSCIPGYPSLNSSSFSIEVK